MFLSILSIAIVAGLAYIWMTRGFFSSLLNLLCVIVAGAIAFSLFEPLAYLILEKAPATGFMSPVGSSAWAIGLGAPFAITLALLRVGVDKACGKNVGVKTPVNYAGGAVCGALAGVITAGVTVMSIGFLRLDADFMGYQPVQHGGDSSLMRTSSLILPVDKLTSNLYGLASESSLSTDSPLAKFYPSFSDVPPTMRMNQGNGAGKNTILPKDFSINGWYSVGGDKAPLNSLLSDSWTSKAQSVTDLSGNSFPPASKLFGFVVEFTSGAKEKNGQVVLRAAQVRLVSESADGTERIAAHPIAVVTRAQLAKINYARFRYDTRDLDIASVNGDSAPKMAFEFVVPNGYQPIAFYLKNVRYDVPAGAKPPTEYPDTASRDAGIKNGTLLRTTVDPEERGGTGVQAANTNRNQEDTSVEIRNALPQGRVIQDGSQRGLSVNIPYVSDGKAVFAPKEMDPRAIPKELKIDRFESTKDTVIVQVDVGINGKSSILGKAAEAADLLAAPYLVANDGQRFEAVGYWYEDRDKIAVRYTVGEPIRSMQELTNEGVAVTKSRSDQKLVLVFRPPMGTEIVSFSIGDVEINKFAKPILLDRVQK